MESDNNEVYEFLSGLHNDLQQRKNDILSGFKKLCRVNEADFEKDIAEVLSLNKEFFRKTLIVTDIAIKLVKFFEIMSKDDSVLLEYSQLSSNYQSLWEFFTGINAIDFFPDLGENTSLDLNNSDASNNSLTFKAIKKNMDFFVQKEKELDQIIADYAQFKYLLEEFLNNEYDKIISKKDKLDLSGMSLVFDVDTLLKQ